MSSVIDKFKTLARTLTSAATTMTDAIAQRRQQIVEKAKEVQHARTDLIPVSEIIETRIPETVHEAGAYAIADLGPILIQGIGAPVLGGSVRLPWDPKSPLEWRVICAAMPETAIAILTALVRQIQYEPGPSSAERPATIERLERELAALEIEEEAAVDQACAAGVQIAHRAEVIARRQAEARQRELVEAATADRRRRQEAIDAKAAARAEDNRHTAPGGSAYLARESATRPH